MANATSADDRVLTVVANLDIQFSSPEAAIQVGHAICPESASGVAAGESGADIRGGVVTA